MQDRYGSDEASEPEEELNEVQAVHEAFTCSAKPKRRESTLEYELRQRGWQFERRSKRLIYKRVRPGSDKENVAQAFAVSAHPKDRRRQKAQLSKLRRMEDAARDHVCRQRK